MKLSKAQQEAHTALLSAPDGRISSGSGVGRRTIDAMERAGLVAVNRQFTRKTRRHRNGTTSEVEITTWTARLKPTMPTAQEQAELDLIIKNGEGILRPAQHRQAAAYVAHMLPTVALKGSPASKPGYRPADGYAEAMNWPASKLLDMVMMIRHMSGQTPIPAQRTADIGEPTDVWGLFTKTDDGSPGKELGRVRAPHQNAAALLGSSLLNQRGGYTMRRLGSLEVGGWVEDFRAHGLVLRLEATADGDGFQVTGVSNDDIMTIRPTAEEAKRDALADLTSLFTALAPSDEPDTIRAD